MPISKICTFGVLVHDVNFKQTAENSTGNYFTAFFVFGRIRRLKFYRLLALALPVLLLRTYVYKPLQRIRTGPVKLFNKPCMLYVHPYWKFLRLSKLNLTEMNESTYVENLSLDFGFHLLIRIWTCFYSMILALKRNS